MNTSSQTPREILSRLKAAALTNAQTYLRRVQPIFRRRIALGRSYEDLFSERATGNVDLSEFYALAIDKARVMLCGRGGAGKTTILRQMVLLAAAKGAVPVFVDLKKWSAHHSAVWAARRGGAGHELLDFLLSEFTDTKTDTAELDILAPEVVKVLFIDGLNEVPSEVSGEIIAAADILVRLLFNIKVVVSDRLTRRQLREKRWAFVWVDELSDDAVAVAWRNSTRPLSELQKMRASQRSLIRNPFFLDRALRLGIRPTRGETMKSLLLTHGGLRETELGRVSETAYQLYLAGKSRSFSAQDFQTLVGDNELLARLKASGLIIDLGGDRAAFSHHWYHDFLAALHVASMPEIWGYQAFNAITFDANSFDAIAFVLEQLGRDQTDRFLRSVYDWNIYATGYALSEIDGLQLANVDPDTRFAALSMLAERRFDRIYATAERASDALRLFVTDDARRLRDAASLTELVDVVRGHTLQNESLLRWQTLFVRDPTAGLSDAEIEQLRDGDSFVGWTLANVMKRMALPPSQLRLLAEFARQNGSNVLRWRAVHVLGAFPSPDALEILLERLKTDTDHLVRYGAIRSLVEMASRASPEFRHEIFGRLSNDVGTLKSSALAMGEFSRSVFLKKDATPESWAEEVGRVTGALIDVAEDTAEIDRWSRLASDIRTRHAA